MEPDKMPTPLLERIREGGTLFVSDVAHENPVPLSVKERDLIISAVEFQERGVIEWIAMLYPEAIDAAEQRFGMSLKPGGGLSRPVEGSL